MRRPKDWKWYRVWPLLDDEKNHFVLLHESFQTFFLDFLGLLLPRNLFLCFLWFNFVPRFDWWLSYRAVAWGPCRVWLDILYNIQQPAIQIVHGDNDSLHVLCLHHTNHRGLWGSPPGVKLREGHHPDRADVRYRGIFIDLNYFGDNLSANPWA